jgi:hypothetical protein
MATSNFVHTLAIRRWADRLDARSTLPKVLRRLVRATVKKIAELDFPALESVQRSGFDGVVDCEEGNAWVPDGRSVWELGVNKGVKSKADEDFEKRTKETPKAEQESTTYVFVTPRHWEKKKEWASEQRGKGHWKGVRAFDADDLEQWLESAPPVGVWFGRLIGSRPIGVDDVEARWDSLAKCASRHLLPSVFVSGRESNVQQLRDWFSGEPKPLALQTRSPIEAVYFVCAAIAGLDESEREAVESRCIIVESLDAWRMLRDAETPAILLVDPAVTLASEEIARAVSHGHHILVAVEPAYLLLPGFELQRSNQYDLSRALEECGYESVKAEQLARAAGGSLAILKNLLDRSKTKPAWVEELDSNVVTACLLLGGWDSAVDADRAAFEKLARKPYAECEPELQRMALSENPLLLHADNKWRLISRDHAWSVLQGQVSAASISEFSTLATETLVDDDPRYDLPEDERPYASLRGHDPRYSGTIKKHVAESLALLGEFGPQFEAASSTDIVATVNRVVADVLPPTCTWHRWASLGPRLPLLAEASPRSFLNAVRADLKAAEPQLFMLLREEEDAFFGRCNHAGLLWALETLAWSKQYLGEVASTLVSLAEGDPGGRWANRPANSLCEILSHWMPYTTASVDERTKVLDLMIRQNPEAAWPILIGLLPSVAGSASTPTHKPYWRDWANQWHRGATHGESLAFMTATAERVIDQAGTAPQRWKTVFEHIGSFPYTVHDKFLEAATTFAESQVSDLDRKMVAEELAEQINRHRHFEDAGWSLPEAILKRLDTIHEKLKPRSVVLQNAWLFAQWPDRFFESGADHTERQEALDDTRGTAISEILSSEGFAGIEALVAVAEAPEEVGRSLSMTTGDLHREVIIPAKLEGDTAERRFAAGFVWNRFYPDHWEWADSALESCTTEDSKAWFSSMLPFSREVWQRVEGAGASVGKLYWERCRAFNPRLESDDVQHAVARLVENGRVGCAIDLLSMALHNKRTIDEESLFRPLEALLKLPTDQQRDQVGQNVRHGIQEIIENLQDRDDLDQNRLIVVEWHFLRLLDGHTGHAPRTLQSHLGNSPAFFIEVLSFAFRSRDVCEQEGRPEPTAHERYMAEQAHRLLSEWNVVPGTDENGKVDEAMLRAWCCEVRRLAEESGRAEICDDFIGHVFAQAPEDGDGTWPCSAVRSVAEEIGTDDLASGMHCGIMNSRGAGFRASGGDQERELAQQYREKSDRIRFESPFVARVLDSVAESYEREAKWWDERGRWEET